MAGRPRKLTPDAVARTREWWVQWQAMPKPADVRRSLGVSETTFRQMLRHEIYKRG